MTQKETIKKVLHYIRRYRFFLIVSLVLALITVVLTLYVPILTGQAVDLIVGKGQVDFAGVYHICVKIGIAILLTMVAQWVMNVANNKITYSVVRDIRTDAFEKIQVLPLSYIDSHSYGGIVSRVIADADQFADGLLMGFTQLFTGVITILGTLGFMLSVSVPIALVVVVLTPVSLFVAAFIAKRTYQMFRMQSETRGEQTALIEEMILLSLLPRPFPRSPRSRLESRSSKDLAGRLSKMISSFSSPMFIRSSAAASSNEV